MGVKILKHTVILLMLVLTYRKKFRQKLLYGFLGQKTLFTFPA